MRMRINQSIKGYARRLDLHAQRYMNGLQWISGLHHDKWHGTHDTISQLLRRKACIKIPKSVAVQIDILFGLTILNLSRNERSAWRRSR